MFDVSWGEMIMLGAIGVALTGRRDLPTACRFAGTQIGRVVGLLQGARARADQFAGQNELRQLQNELRSGLRELDQVKTEMAVAASTQGVLGRTLGVTTPSANRLISGNNSSPLIQNLSSDTKIMQTSKHLPDSQPVIGQDGFVEDTLQKHSPSLISSLPPVEQTERAVMEEEWEKRGIGFRSVAERGDWLTKDSAEVSSRTGSELLENIIKQNLIFDQYDRVVGEQESEMQQKVEKFKEKRNK